MSSENEQIPAPIDPMTSEALVTSHGLAQITETDGLVHDLLSANILKLQQICFQELAATHAMALDDATKITDRLMRAFKAHYELLALKGKIHDRDDRRGKIIARVGIRQTPQGQEAVAEVEVTPGHHSA